MDKGKKVKEVHPLDELISEKGFQWYLHDRTTKILTLVGELNNFTSNPDFHTGKSICQNAQDVEKITHELNYLFCDEN